MVGLKENLIKLTDYPFTYSVLGYISIMGLQTNVTPVNASFGGYVPILIFIGIIGTILSIIDPFGRLAKYIIIIAKKNRYEKFIASTNPLKYSEDYQEFQNNKNFFIRLHIILKKVSGLHFSSKYEGTIDDTTTTKGKVKKARSFNTLRILSTTWITYEIDKVVSTFYFIITLILLIFIIGNTFYYDKYIDFANFNFNSTNTTENSINTLSNCTNIDEGSEQTNNTINLYCKIREPVLIAFLVSLALLTIVFIHSCYTLSDKINTLNKYYELTEEIDRNTYQDTVRTELNNLDKNLLDSLNAHDWGLAKEFLNRIEIVVKRRDDSRINPSVNTEKTE